MFLVDEATATAIRRAWDEGGEAPALAELRRHFPFLVDDAPARSCLRAIAGWTPLPVRDRPPGRGGPSPAVPRRDRAGVRGPSRV